MAKYSRVSGSVALISLQNPPVNALSATVRRGLMEVVQLALCDPDVSSLVICGVGGVFCGGADIKEFGSTMSGPPLVPMIHDIEASEKPVVAAIEGLALGGGLELSLGCHYRVCHSKAKLGLPEVSLGLIPGAGGTQRLPRLIGVPAALDLITSGRHVSSSEALGLGMVDLVTDENTVEAAVSFAVTAAVQPLHSRRISSLVCPRPTDCDAMFEDAMLKVRRASRGAFAPVACVQAVRAAATLPYAQGMRREAELMASLFGSGQARALQHCFFVQRAVARWTTPGGARWDASEPRSIRTAAVIGLGTMGRGIAVALAQAGISVVAVETQEQQLLEARREVSGMLERAARRKGAEPRLHLVSYSCDLATVAAADLVVEAVFEDLVLKQQLFRRLSDVCRPNTLLCTNTSALDIDQLAAHAQRPDLVVGTHFFAPAQAMKLLEVVYGRRSSPEAVATAMALGRKLGKVSVAVGNCRGFVGNRMLMPYVEQAEFLLEEGATPDQVDALLEEFGFAMGVFRMSDLAGLDVGWRVRRGSSEARPGEASLAGRDQRYSPLGDLLCEQGRFGQKTGSGWYRYERPGGRVAIPDPWMHGFLRDYRARRGLATRSVDRQEVLERCLYALINEGLRILEDGIAAGPEHIDAIYVLGYGWPAHRGGPMFYAATVGLKQILERLDFYHRVHPDTPQLQPCSLLRSLVAAGSPPMHRWTNANPHRVHSQL